MCRERLFTSSLRICGGLMNLIEYILNKKSILKDLEEMESIDRDYDIMRNKYSKAKRKIEELEEEVKYLNERQTKNLKRIRELRKELKGLKNDNKI